MPLKQNKKNLTANPNPVTEGAIIQTPEGKPMSLFSPAMLPAVTLNANQFAWPKTLLVMAPAKRMDINEVNPQTGWDAKDSSGNKIKTGQFKVRLTVANGDLAQLAVDNGEGLDSLSTLQCDIMKDVPTQTFVPFETLIELVEPVVMLGFGGQSADRIILRAASYKAV